MATLDARTLGGRIREARKRAGLSQDDVGQAVGIDRTAVAKIESGVRRLTALELADVADAIGVRMSAFFNEPVPALVSHRSSQGLDTADSQIDALLATLAAEVEFVASLGVLPGEGADKLPRGGFERPSSGADAEAMALDARRLMGLPPDRPIEGLVAAVATLGLLAFSRDIGKDTADAGTIMLRRGAVSLVNSHMKVGRRRLALAHELGHYLVQDDYTVDWRVTDPSTAATSLESRLDRFARALLLPQTPLMTLWEERAERIGQRGAAIAIASEFRVDMATLAARLSELGAADAAAVAAVRGFTTTQSDILELDLLVPVPEMEGVTVPRDFARAVIKLVKQNRISRERAVDLLQGTIAEDELPPVRLRDPNEIWKYVT